MCIVKNTTIYYTCVLSKIHLYIVKIHPCNVKKTPHYCQKPTKVLKKRHTDLLKTYQSIHKKYPRIVKNTPTNCQKHTNCIFTSCRNGNTHYPIL